MAYASSLPFGEIRDFRDAEINGIPALFTMYRLDPGTLPADFHSCEVMGGRGSDFQWLVPLALTNFTGTFVTRQPCSGKDRHMPKYAGTASSTQPLSTNGLKIILLCYYATNEYAGIRFSACAGNHHPKQPNHGVVQHTDCRQLFPRLSDSYPRKQRFGTETAPRGRLFTIDDEERLECR